MKLHQKGKYNRQNKKTCSRYTFEHERDGSLDPEEPPGRVVSTTLLGTAEKCTTTAHCRTLQ